VAFSQVQRSPPVWRGLGCGLSLGDHMLQCRTFTLCMRADSESSKLLYHPKAHAYGGKFCRFAVTKEF
jgi:hypothetical protein